jgi:dipeptidyl aminopeptidase/acylaminoacyl peptidase
MPRVSIGYPRRDAHKTLLDLSRNPVGRDASACLSVALPAAAVDTPDSFPSNETMRHFRSLNDPQLAPDGTRALLRVDDSAADGGKSHLWLIDVGGKKPRQLTFSPNTDKRGERAGQWAPDGQSILFLAHRGEQTSIYTGPMDVGEAHALDIKVRPIVDASKVKDALPPAKPGETPEPVEDLPVDIESFRVSPDGAWLAFIAHDPETPARQSGPLAFALFGAPSTEPWHGFDARHRVVAFIEKAFGP